MSQHVDVRRRLIVDQVGVETGRAEKRIVDGRALQHDVGVVVGTRRPRVPVEAVDVAVLLYEIDAVLVAERVLTEVLPLLLEGGLLCEYHHL